MNWNNLQTYGLSSEKTFEMICNQLFENWCKEEYAELLSSFTVVNGSGGDGGVESIAVLKDDSVIGLQAKWFRTNLSSSQISQIKNSLTTAKRVRPKITKYIICVPRDICSTTMRGSNTEEKRWNDFVSEMNASFPGLTIDLWNDTRITTEMQKPSSVGICRYWFTNTAIDSETLSYSFEKAKKSWLSTKYVPDLDTEGQISYYLSRFIGDFDIKEELSEHFVQIVDLCKRYKLSADNLIKVCKNSFPTAAEILKESIKQIDLIQIESKKINDWLIDEFKEQPVFDKDAFYISFESIKHKLKESRVSSTFHFHLYDVINILNKLSDINFFILLDEIHIYKNNSRVLFLGNPGVGKTHGVSAFVEKEITRQYHFPIIVQARSVSEVNSWKDIIVNTLSLSSSWNEDELFQALISSANRNRLKETYVNQLIKIVPKVLIVVDGIDESSSGERWVSRMEEAMVITSRYPQIRFCFTSRPIIHASWPKHIEIFQLNDAGDVPVSKLFDKYIQKYNISIQNCHWLKYAINTPLALKLFCELYANKTFSTSMIPKISMDQLWRTKIDRMQAEFNAKNGYFDQNQSIFLMIVFLSKCFIEKAYIERSELLAQVTKNNNISNEVAEKALYHLEQYGIIGSYCEKGTGLTPDSYIYFSGIQGYFDYAAALHIIEMNKHPSLIRFDSYKEVNYNTLYCLAIISIQQYGFLLTDNPTINHVLNRFGFFELQCYALQHSDAKAAIQYRKYILEIMESGADALVVIVNRLVLPLSRIPEHPLGASLLDDFLTNFEKPAQRDIVWSLPAYLRHSEGKRWGKSDSVFVIHDKNEEYQLTVEDSAEGLPIIYAWMLSSVDNTVRRDCRNKLMVWARTTPWQYFMLFQHFSDVNDPQIKSDLYSILMCLVCDCSNYELTKTISDWIISNTLSPTVIDRNRDVSVRYYAVSIIEKALMLGIYSKDSVKEYLPPYTVSNNEIEMSKDALAGTRMSGYSAIGYDLARYVLVDYLCYGFNTWENKQLDTLIMRYGDDHPDFRNISSDQFIISAAYAFIIQMGWNEREFYSNTYDESGNLNWSVDYSISASYPAADHGAQSAIMTVCEKYVWAARNYISGFLCDRLRFGDKQIKVTDYNLLDSFFIPIQEVYQKDPDQSSVYKPLYVPEPSAVSLDEEMASIAQIRKRIKNAPDIDWEKWIHVENRAQLFSISHSELLALYSYSCFYGLSGVETILFLNSIVLPTDQVSQFVTAVHKKELFERICDPTDWSGEVESSCYITPKEVCWFPWKKHFDSYKTIEFPDLSIHSAVDRCCYNYPEYNDVYYYMPSATIRNLMGIIDTDNGYLFFDKNKNILSEYSIAGEKWRTSQDYVLVGTEDVITKLSKAGLSLIWIMQEVRDITGNAKEIIGDHYAERRQYYIGYYEKGRFISEKLIVDYSEN